MPQSDATTLTTRHIDLEPQNWLWATWRPRPSLPAPAPVESAPFNLDRSLKLLRRKALKHDANAFMNWDLLELPKELSRQAAHFWFTALTAPVNGVTLDQFADCLAGQTYTGNIGREQIAERILAMQQRPSTAAASSNSGRANAPLFSGPT